MDITERERLISEFIEKWYKKRKDISKIDNDRIAKLNIPNKDKLKSKIKEALFILERQYVGGIDNLVEQIEGRGGKRDFWTRMEEVIEETSIPGIEKANIAFALYLSLKQLKDNEDFNQEWIKLKNKWGFLFVPDAFYPDKYSKNNIKKWEKEFIQFYLKNGVIGVEKLFSRIGKFLARFNIDAVYNGYPIYFYTAKLKIGIEKDEMDRVYKVFKFPLRYTYGEIKDLLPLLNEQIELLMYGKNLEVKNLHVFYKYSWGEGIRGEDFFRVGTDGFKWKREKKQDTRNQQIRDLYGKLKKKGCLDSHAYKIIAIRFPLSESAIRHIVKKHTKS